MFIAVGIPAFNEEIFIERSVENCIEMGYDYVVYLDDGSTDSTYEKLLEFTEPYDHIKVIQNKTNSVLDTKNMGRWEKVARECKKVNPDWIMVRAADECLSAAAAPAGRDALRSNLEALYDTRFGLVSFQYIDFWRSKWWYRADGFWGVRSSVSCWRNNTGWAFDYKKGIHQGAHMPNRFKIDGLQKRNINISGSWDIVVLHYGMSSDELLERKLDYQLSTANAIGNRALGVPTSMPHPSRWNRFNGYKIAHEIDIELRPAKQIWFFEQIPKEPKPAIKPLTHIIEKYDSRRAFDYENLYKKHFDKQK